MPLKTDIKKALENHRSFFYTGITHSYEWRIEQLEKLKHAIESHQQEIVDALYADFKKPEIEVYVTEIDFTLKNLEYTLHHLKEWMEPERVSVPLAIKPAKGYRQPEPIGVVLVIAPWNYPFQLLFAPLIGALAAGNVAVLKPSEISSHTAAISEKIVRSCFDENVVSVFQGGKETNQALLEHKFDHIFFTGSTFVGKIVMQAAAKFLTPVTLELGGQNPTVIDESAHIPTTVRRICLGKFLNSGQTCIAPNHLYVHKNIKDKFIKQFKKTVKEFYGDDPQQSADFARIISDRHYARMEEKLKSGTIVSGGRFDKKDRYIEPTLLDDISWDSAIMEDEIFGPILPIMEFTDVKEIVEKEQGRAKPLAFYVFTKNKENEQYLLQHIQSGGACINDNLIQVSPEELPFGGVGESGIGSYHGKKSFETLSHYRSIVKRPFWLDVTVKYPPYSEWFKNLFKWLG